MNNDFLDIEFQTVKTGDSKRLEENISWIFWNSWESLGHRRSESPDRIPWTPWREELELGVWGDAGSQREQLQIDITEWSACVLEYSMENQSV